MENDDDVTLIFDMDEALDLLVATGFRKPVCSLSKSDCSSIASTLLDYHFVFKVNSEMDQYKDGLNTFGLLDNLRCNPELWKPYFVFKPSVITPGWLIVSVTWHLIQLYLNVQSLLSPSLL